MYLVLAMVRKDLLNALRYQKHTQEVSYSKKRKKSPHQRNKKWKYLNPITAEITQNDHIEVGMLIEANCIKALEPEEIIASQDERPYIYRTK